MGLFDKLLKAAYREFVQKENVKSRSVSAAGSDAYSFRGTPEAYFADLIGRKFPEYEIRRNVTVVNTGVQNVPVTFMFIKDERPVYAIILCYSQIYNRKRILNTMDACTRQGIPVHRFFEDFRNEETYVCDRIRTVLK